MKKKVTPLYVPRQKSTFPSCLNYKPRQYCIHKSIYNISVRPCSILLGRHQRTFMRPGATVRVCIMNAQLP